MSAARPELRATVRIFVHNDSPRAPGTSGHDGTLCLGTAALLDGIREQGSLVKAAASIGMSSRVASYRMRKLESELGYKLYKRLPSNKGSRLTSRGAELLDSYRSICDECETFVNERLANMQKRHGEGHTGRAAAAAAAAADGDAGSADGADPGAAGPSCQSGQPNL